MKFVLSFTLALLTSLSAFAQLNIPTNQKYKGNVRSVEITNYVYEDNKATISTKDGAKVKEVYNEDGQQTEYAFYYPSDDAWGRIQREFNSAKQLVKVSSYRAGSTNGKAYIVEEFNYNNYPQELKSDFYIDNYGLIDSRYITYNDSGDVLMDEQLNASTAELVYRLIYKRDENSRLISKEKYVTSKLLRGSYLESKTDYSYKGDKLVESIEYKYSSNHILLGKTIKKFKGKEQLKSLIRTGYGVGMLEQHEFKYKYAKGKQVEISKSLNDEANGSIEMTYNDKGQLQEEISYNKEGKPYQQVSYSYDHLGNRTSKLTSIDNLASKEIRYEYTYFK